MDGYQGLDLVEKSAPLPLAHQSSRQALLVLGMSRSGTSVLTHVLHALGAALPRDLMGAAHGNPLGHFEPRELVALNDRILESIDRRWNDPRPIAPQWFRSRAAFQFLRAVTTQLRQSYGEAPLLVLKDPRLCRLLPLYLDALDTLDVEPLVILQVRAMQEVVQSLVERDGMQPDLAEFLWLRSVVEAEWQSRDCRRVWVSMAEILADWPGTTRRIADSLRLEWPVSAMTEIGSLLKPRQRHHIAPSVYDPAGVRRFSTAAWAAIEHGLAGEEHAARAGFDTVRNALQDFDRMYQPALAALAGGRRWLPRRLIGRLRALRGSLRDALTR
jgi:hypothetical protein